MQRKNYLLKRRNGFAMIMALSVIVIIATIMAISMSMTAQTTKRSTDLYIYEQAVLLSKSAAEYALLRISQDGACSHTNDLNFTPDLDGDGNPDFYDVNISIKYIYTAPSPCASANDDYFTITTPEQNGSVLMDISVSVDDTTVTSEPIRYFRRSIQKL
jgi:Tfp pilus assembly protein PilX